MFERYTEPARRVIFFARYEAATLGSHAIDTEHLLLGLLREGVGATILHDAGLTSATARKAIGGQVALGQAKSTSVDIPLSDAAKRALTHAVEEADRLNAERLDTEHLLLGLLRERETVAGEILAAHALHLDAVRETLRLSLLGRSSPVGPTQPFERLVDFLRQLEDRRAHYHVSLFRPTGLRVEIALPEERWTATFFADGRVAVEVFWLSSDVQDEGSLQKLIERLGARGDTTPREA